MMSENDIDSVSSIKNRLFMIEQREKSRDVPLERLDQLSQHIYEVERHLKRLELRIENIEVKRNKEIIEQVANMLKEDKRIILLDKIKNFFKRNMR
jgi:acetate kinase